MKRPRNCRKSQKINVLTGRAFHAVLFIASLLVMVVLNIVADARCTQVQSAIGEKEKRLEKLEKDIRRESTKWAQMTTEDNLERALVRHGLKMRVPVDEQIIRMDSSGRPKYGQPSVELAKRRQATVLPVASATSGSRRRTTVRR